MPASRVSYRQTLYACYIGYITQAIINNLAPLLFLTFHRQFGISLERIGLLITVNFGIQILTDIAASKLIDKIGYRVSAVAAHVFATIGLVSMGVLPGVMADPFLGLAIAMGVNAIGGGLIEVLISPIVEALPGEQKASAMSLLHSFYCWGHVSVVVLSTIFFVAFGLGAWPMLPLLWALVPFFNVFLFSKVPLLKLVEDHERIPLRKLFRVKLFWILLLLMICAGASEQAMAQWSSLFAEAGLGVSKTAGDLLGPCAFAVSMGVARTFFGLQGARLKLERALVLSGILCIASYLVTVFSPSPLLSLIGCSVSGLGVAVMWPGVLSLSGKYYPFGGTAMFAMLALGGDIGCAAGPALVGVVSDTVAAGRLAYLSRLVSAADITGVGLKTGLMMAMVFPVLLVAGIQLMKKIARPS